jgi:hypothetical protein
MQVKGQSSVHIYYITVIVAAVAIMGVGLRLLWSSGSINFEAVTAAFEASALIEDMKSRNDVDQMKELIESDRARDSFKLLERLDQNVKTLNDVKRVNGFDELSLSIADTKLAYKALISYPEMSSVIGVLSKRVEDFESFVSSNKWPTLTRTAQRVQAKLVTGGKASEFYSQSKLKNLAQGLASEFQAMISLTEGSVLSADYKNQIVSKIKGMGKELEMIQSYVHELEKFNIQYANLKKKYSSWQQEMRPAVGLSRYEMEKNSKTMLFGLLGVMGFLLLALPLGQLVQRKARKNYEQHFDQALVASIQDGLLPLESKMPHRLGNKAQADFIKLRDYVHKRMSFGTIFQEATPFSSLLLDSNLNVVWSNELFSDTWRIEVRGTDTPISWDYLQQFTNLGENDPVQAALQEGIAGIFQIQVRHGEGEDTLPYEMYVSPVDHAEQRRIMIFFYPLRSVEETLSNQTRAIVGPVSRTLDALVSDGFSNEFKEKIAKDYDISGTNEIFEKFNRYYAHVNQQKMDFLNEIENLETALIDQHKLAEDIKRKMAEIGKVQQETIRSFEMTRDLTVGSVDLRYRVEAEANNAHSIAKSLMKAEQSILGMANKAGGALEENFRAISGLTSAREQLRGLKLEIENLRSKLFQTLDQGLVTSRISDNAFQRDETLAKVKTELREFDRALGGFAEISRMFDVSLSKLELINRETRLPELKEVQEELGIQSRKLSESEGLLIQATRTGESRDEELVKCLRQLYEGFLEQGKKGREVSSLLEEKGPEHGHSLGLEADS